MKIGIATSSFASFPITEAVRIIAEAGYECVDIWGGRPHIYRQDYSSTELRNLRFEIEGRGMEVSSFMPAFFRYPYNLCSPNPMVRQDSLEYVYQSMDNLLTGSRFCCLPTMFLWAGNIKCMVAARRMSTVEL